MNDNMALTTYEERSGIVTLPVSVAEAVEQFKQYQELTRLLLDDSDYQRQGGDRFKKKSAWRKYAKAFNLTDKVSFEDIRRDDRGHPVMARIRVVVTAPNGRQAEADHECHVSERCCPIAFGEPCFRRAPHNHCPQGCSGRAHWSHPGDIPATALTRAKNRAISDLIGAGEVSAEEIGERAEVEGEGERRQQQRPAPPRGKKAAAPVEDADRRAALERVEEQREELRAAVDAAGLRMEDVQAYLRAQGVVVPITVPLVVEEAATAGGVEKFLAKVKAWKEDQPFE